MPRDAEVDFTEFVRASSARLFRTAYAVCGDYQLAEDAVPKFHEQLDAGQFQDIYDQSGEDLKQAANRQEFIALLDAVHRKLGNGHRAS